MSESAVELLVVGEKLRERDSESLVFLGGESEFHVFFHVISLSFDAIQPDKEIRVFPFHSFLLAADP